MRLYGPLLALLIVACQPSSDDSAAPELTAVVEVECPLEDYTPWAGMAEAVQLDEAPATVQVWGCSLLDDEPFCSNVFYYLVTTDHKIVVEEGVCESFEYLSISWTY